MMARQLNIDQRNRIITVLRFLELDLLQAYEALAGPRHEAFLVRTRVNVPDERRAALAAEIEAALRELAALARDLDLPMTKQDVTGQIAAALSVDGADLANSTSKTLGQYGPVESGVAEILDERTALLSKRALAIAHHICEDAGE